MHRTTKVTIIVALTLALVLGTAGMAGAIIDGWLDGEDHPYVGLMVADVDGVPARRCSGTLISPTVFLTAGHCTFGADTARVWFDTDLSDNAEYPYAGVTSIEGVPIAHPVFDGSLVPPNTSDVGVVILSEPVTDLGFGELPEIGYADELNLSPGISTLMEVVGYGVQAVKPLVVRDLVRYNTTPMLVETVGIYAGGYNIHLSSNHGVGGGTGGACSGDSGGPALAYPGSNVVVGVGSFVINNNCAGVGYYYRVDTAYAQEFILQFLP